MPYTDNPIADYDRYDMEQMKWLQRLPVCAECGEPIQDEECYDIDGELVCAECLRHNHRVWTEDYMND